jgi:hypothetical protein
LREVLREFCVISYKKLEPLKQIFQLLLTPLDQGKNFKNKVIAKFFKANIKSSFFIP